MIDFMMRSRIILEQMSSCSCFFLQGCPIIVDESGRLHYYDLVYMYDMN